MSQVFPGEREQETDVLIQEEKAATPTAGAKKNPFSQPGIRTDLARQKGHGERGGGEHRAHAEWRRSLRGAGSMAQTRACAQVHVPGLGTKERI